MRTRSVRMCGWSKEMSASIRTNIGAEQHTGPQEQVQFVVESNIQVALDLPLHTGTESRPSIFIHHSRIGNTKHGDHTLQ